MIRLLSLLFFSLASIFASRAQEEAPSKPGDTILVAETGKHTLFVLPLRNHMVDWDSIINLADLNGNGEKFKYLGFGWGELKYYIHSSQTGDMNLRIAAKALFWPTEPVMKVDAYPELHEGPDVIAIPVDAEQYMAIYHHIVNSFLMGQDGRPQKIAEIQSLHEAFYSSHGKYTLFNNSNHWTARGLKAARLKYPKAPVTSGPIMRQLRRNY